MKRLTLEDLGNPMFDKQKFVSRKVDGKKSYEGATFTDNFVLVGITYFVGSGQLSIKNTGNKQLFLGKVTTPKEFSAAMKKADKKLSKMEA